MFSSLSYLYHTGDIAQLNLPVGMQDLNLYGTNVTGKTTSLNEGHIPGF